MLYTMVFIRFSYDNHNLNNNDHLKIDFLILNQFVTIFRPETNVFCQVKVVHAVRIQTTYKI